MRSRIHHASPLSHSAVAPHFLAALPTDGRTLALLTASDWVAAARLTGPFQCCATASTGCSSGSSSSIGASGI